MNAMPAATLIPISSSPFYAGRASRARDSAAPVLDSSVAAWPAEVQDGRGGNIAFQESDYARLKILHAARERRISQRQAAAQLQVSVRWVRKLVGRLRQRGERAVLHGLRGRPSNRQVPPEVAARALALIRSHYQGFGPTRVAAELAGRYGLRVSRETVRKWMIAEGLWRPYEAGTWTNCCR